MGNGTDPVELAWCAFARERSALGFPVELREQGISVASFRGGAEWERATCMELVRAAGCLCLDSEGRPRSDFDAVTMMRWENSEGVYREWREVEIHDPRCPHALAERIEARGRG